MKLWRSASRSKKLLHNKEVFAQELGDCFKFDAVDLYLESIKEWLTDAK